ncbi:hypothetical protein ABZZ74_42610 [Streptomyces sp. NPDC006476]|uniref:hypothetical protein n=1 Tax=Streptomyces sp. NPDC006476 TaxID=3157175 RepID=UPI0033B0E7DE
MPSSALSSHRLMASPSAETSDQRVTPVAVAQADMTADSNRVFGICLAVDGVARRGAEDKAVKTHPSGAG